MTVPLGPPWRFFVCHLVAIEGMKSVAVTEAVVRGSILSPGVIALPGVLFQIEHERFVEGIEL